MKASMHVLNGSSVFMYYQDPSRSTDPHVTESRFGIRYHTQQPGAIDAAPAVALLSVDKGREFLQQRVINKDLPATTQEALTKIRSLL